MASAAVKWEVAPGLWQVVPYKFFSGEREIWKGQNKKYRRAGTRNTVACRSTNSVGEVCDARDSDWVEALPSKGAEFPESNESCQKAKLRGRQDEKEE